MSDETPQVQTSGNPSEEQDTPTEPVSADGYKALKEEEAAEEGRYIEVRDRKFRVADQLPGIILLDLGLASDPNATQGEQLRTIRQFLHAAIHENDAEAFEVYLRTARPVIEMDELNGIVEKLVEEVAGRPTE